MNNTTRPYWIIAALFVLIGIAGLVRAQFAEAVGSVAMAISFLLFAPPRTRNKTIAGYILVGIAIVSVVVWLSGLTNFRV